MFKPYLQPNFIFKLTKMSTEFNECLKIIEDFNNEIITQRRLELASRQAEDQAVDDDEEEENIYLGTKKRKMVLMDILLQSQIDGKPLTDEEVREEANTFLFAGHDTVSSALMFLFYNLAKYPEIQEKVLTEIREIFEGDQEITFGKLANLQYLECVIKESMRIYAPVPMFGRESQEEIKLSEGKYFLYQVALFIQIYLFQAVAQSFPSAATSHCVLYWSIWIRTYSPIPKYSIQIDSLTRTYLLPMVEGLLTFLLGRSIIIICIAMFLNFINCISVLVPVAVLAND